MSTMTNRDNHTNGHGLLLLPPNMDPETSTTTTNERMSFDVTDALPKKIKITIFDLTVVCISIGTFLCDYVLDIILACYYFMVGQWWYFSLTTAFIIIPNVIMSLFSLNWYINDSKNENLPKSSRTEWGVRIVCIVLLLSPVIRYVNSIRYGIESRRKAKVKDTQSCEINYVLMIYEDNDACLLRLFECFMEAAPQVILQVYILVNDDFTTSEYTLAFKLVTVSMSLLSMAWSLTAYNRVVRFSQNNKKNMSWQGTVFQFFWHFFVVTSRLLVLALFASIFPKYIGLVCLIHWIIMTCWLFSQQTTACGNKYTEFLFDMIVAAVYIFCFVNAKDESTRQKYVWFYTICFIENTVLISVWFANVEVHQWYDYPLLTGNFFMFAIGIAFMLIYYQFFHPNVEHETEEKVTQDTQTASRRDSVCVLMRQPSMQRKLTLTETTV